MFRATPHGCNRNTVAEISPKGRKKRSDMNS